MLWQAPNVVMFTNSISYGVAQSSKAQESEDIEGAVLSRRPKIGDLVRLLRLRHRRSDVSNPSCDSAMTGRYKHYLSGSLRTSDSPSSYHNGYARSSLIQRFQ
ncbi:unnamed protein product [Haemonchus placei]|uniref:Uncharacterized protein n=1 Tax=Haemonchus placei TaxID=6290 RepID=A0A0N4X5E9_HAEPC|nr:unnamed protein product [Haemonchus placei]